jgi:hypothetical protein
MITVCVGLFLGALGSAARFFQGNGHAGRIRRHYVKC